MLKPFRKGRPPSQTQVWLGKLYDTVKQWVKLEDSKVKKYVDAIQTVIAQKTITARELLTHVGRTRHMGTIYRPLNAFARGLEKWVYSQRHLDSSINITKPVINDLEFCIWAMQHANKYGTSFDYFIRSVKDPDVVIHTDASLKIGLGAITDDGRYIQHKWSDITLHDPKKKDIVWKELVAVFVILHKIQNELMNKVVHVFTDNEAVKWMLINMRSPLYRPDLQILINRICQILIKFKIHLWMEYINTKENIIADALSRYHAEPFATTTKTYSQIDATSFLQAASNLSREFKVKNKYLVFKDD